VGRISGLHGPAFPNSQHQDRIVHVDPANEQVRADRNLKAGRSEVEQTVAVGFDPVQLPDSSQRLVQLVEIGIAEVVADVDFAWRDGTKWRGKHRPRWRNIAKLETLQIAGL
jgi:hypothetical protein